jgi:antitoxin MazE
MKTAIAQWGNSSAIRIPQNILHKFGGNIGTEIEIDIQDDTLILRKKSRSLTNLLEKVSPENIHHEQVTIPIGKEIW